MCIYSKQVGEWKIFHNGFKYRLGRLVKRKFLFWEFEKIKFYSAIRYVGGEFVYEWTTLEEAKTELQRLRMNEEEEKATWREVEKQKL